MSVTAECLNELVGNEQCCDCESKAPKWASINLGCLICITCSGVHRKLGTHLSQVRSLTLDNWTIEIIENMKKIGGNAKINEYYEARSLDAFPKPTENTNPLYREEYIRAKYETKLFSSDSADDSSNQIKPVNLPTEMVNGEEHSLSKSKKKNSLYKSLKKATTMSNKGMVEFIGMLSVTVLEARNLIVCDNNGYSDPYVILGAGPAGSMDDRSNIWPGQLVKTTTKMKTLSPVWNETLTTCVSDIKSDVLHLEVIDWDRVSEDDFMGYYSLTLADLFGDQDPTQPIKKTFKLKDVKRGEIDIQVLFISLK